ncbi:MAG: hypothetical protein HN535_05985 [Flavobacteriales bacterium]|jgi:hypothetical protein|nr:hypothetical protein [Flavobacteriales bacterium]|tara:strand:+ start:6164 stop:6400 length:237 start_codon:yes stop_codon:yes gene_type:complete
MKSKHIIILLLSVLMLSSCRTKKTFNGTSTLECTDYNGNSSTTKSKKKSKWRLVLYKDGKKIGKKSKKGKSRLFKNKN